MIRKEAWPFYRTISGVRLCWELEEPKGPTGAFPDSALARLLRGEAAASAPRTPLLLARTRETTSQFEQVHLAESVYNVILQKLSPTQLRQLILSISDDNA